MTNAILGPGKRVAAGAAAILATLALSTVATPARAAAAKPELQVSSAVDARIDTAGSTIGFYLHNLGDAPATGVSAVYDAQPTTGDVIFSTLPGDDSCRQSRKAADCQHGDLAPGQTILVYPITLRATDDAKPGPAGTVKVSVSAQGPEGSVAATYELPVSIRPSGSALVVAVDDLGSEQQRVGGGDTVPLHGTVFNFGNTALPGFFVTITLPLGATFAERYGDCAYSGDRPGEPPAGYCYGPQSVTCQLDLTLEPGDGVAFADPASGDAAFNVVFGKNLPGPAEEAGWFEAGEPDDQRLPDARALAKPTGGPSLADKIAELRAKAHPGTDAEQRARASERARAGQPAGTGQPDSAEQPANTEQPASTTDGTGQAQPNAADAAHNAAEFSIWTKPNTHDLEVRVSAVTGAVGDTVQVPYTITNHGPSDGGASWRIVAPSGTVLLPSQWCSFRNEQGEPVPELTEVDCTADSQWPATASGEGVLSSHVNVKIKSAPGTNGSVAIRSLGPSTETGPKSNTAQIMINEPSGGSSGGSEDDDDGLPITGARTGLMAGIGAGALVLGAVLVLLSRRHRTQVPPPAE